jgi:hypothetical protein
LLCSPKASAVQKILCMYCTYLGGADAMRKSGPDVGGTAAAGLGWPVVVGWADSGKWAVFKTCMWPMRKTGGELKAVGDFAYGTPAIHRRPLSGQSTRQAAPKRNIPNTDIRRNNGAGKCDRCAYAPTMFPRKGRPGMCTGTSLPVPTSPQSHVRPSSRKIAGSPSSNLFHDLFI